MCNLLSFFFLFTFFFFAAQTLETRVTCSPCRLAPSIPWCTMKQKLIQDIWVSHLHTQCARTHILYMYSNQNYLVTNVLIPHGPKKCPHCCLELVLSEDINGIFTTWLIPYILIFIYLFFFPPQIHLLWIWM